MRLVATRNALTIAIREYEPSVDCEPRAPEVPDYDSCELALQAVPASRFVRAFVSSGYMEPDRGVTKLPKEYADTSGRCESAAVVFRPFRLPTDYCCNSRWLGCTLTVLDAGVCHIILDKSPSSTATTMTYRDAWVSPSNHHP